MLQVFGSYKPNFYTMEVDEIFYENICGFSTKMVRLELTLSHLYVRVSLNAAQGKALKGVPNVP